MKIRGLSIENEALNYRTTFFVEKWNIVVEVKSKPLS